jgi:DDE superfamily endonuclease
MRELVDVHYPDAACIRVVQDNLSTHSAGSLYEAFPAAEPRRILSRIEFHYTPKHASWVNMVEIEIGVLRGRCLDRRINNPNRLNSESRLREASKRRRRSHQIDVHNRESPHQMGRAETQSRRSCQELAALRTNHRHPNNLTAHNAF